MNIVLAADGYPESPRKGDSITMGDLPANVIVFHAGTRDLGGRLVTSGGRVLNVVGQAGTIDAARSAAYAGAAAITFNGKQFRTDIGAPKEGTQP